MARRPVPAARRSPYPSKAARAPARGGGGPRVPVQKFPVARVRVVCLGRLLIDARFREPLGPVVFQPIGMAYLVAAAVTAALRRLAGIHLRIREDNE